MMILHKNRAWNFHYQHGTNGASSSWHLKVTVPEASVILTVIFCPIADADALNKPAIENITWLEEKVTQ